MLAPAGQNANMVVHRLRHLPLLQLRYQLRHLLHRLLRNLVLASLLVTLKEATVGGPLTRISERTMRGESDRKQAVQALAL
jgi:hypothetical protein